MAGGFDYLTGGAESQTKYHKIVERSTNNGSSFQVLPDFPYGHATGAFEACLVIIDDNTVFLGAGRKGEFFSDNFSPKILLGQGYFHFQVQSIMQTLPSLI